MAIPQKRHDKAVLGFLTKAEMEAIIEIPDQRSWVGQRDRALFTMLYNTGARVSEITGLRVGDIVLDVSPVAHLQGKGRKRRSVPIWKATAVLVRQWVRQLTNATGADYLFPNSSGGRLSRSSVAQRLALAVAHATRNQSQLAGRAISPHTIRHTTAMHLLQAGVDITVIALWLGHESPTTTHIYMEADLAMKEAALNRLQPVNAARHVFDHLTSLWLSFRAYDYAQFKDVAPERNSDATTGCPEEEASALHTARYHNRAYADIRISTISIPGPIDRTAPQLPLGRLFRRPGQSLCAGHVQ